MTASPRHDSMAILVVDDEKLIRMTISAKLRKAGYEVVAVGTVDEAVTAIKDRVHDFGAVISDIMMGDMDGFVFRDIVRGFDMSVPFFFMTALDPEEGSGFLKKIVSDALSFYLPKSVGADALVKRVQRLVASRRVEQFIERQLEEQRGTMSLAGQVQRSMLPQRAHEDFATFHAALWHPQDTVSGDIYEAIPLDGSRWLYVLGDIQGHGPSAAFVMTAVHSFLKNLIVNSQGASLAPHDIANHLQRFFRANLADISYMTALVCIHDTSRREVSWLSCGAPNLVVCGMDGERECPEPPPQKGSLPIGLMPDTAYGPEESVITPLSPVSTCIAMTDGIFDVSSDAEGFEKIQESLIASIARDLVSEARSTGRMAAAPHRLLKACEEYGYVNYQDDVTVMMFGPAVRLDGVYTATIPLSPHFVDLEARNVADWCRSQGWSDGDATRIQLVLEESLMNVHDHGFAGNRLFREVVNVRLARRRSDSAELTVWDCGMAPPSLSVAAGDSATALEMLNRGMSDHGRGRLMTRALCLGIERKRCCGLNETVYHVKLETEAEAAQ